MVVSLTGSTVFQPPAPQFGGKGKKIAAVVAVGALGGAAYAGAQAGVHERAADVFQRAVGVEAPDNRENALDSFLERLRHANPGQRAAFDGTGPVAEFRYYTPASDGSFREVSTDEHFERAEARVKRQFAVLLQNRPDLVQQLRSLPRPLEVHLYQGAQQFGEDGQCALAAGCATLEYRYNGANGNVLPRSINLDIHYTLPNIPDSLNRPADGFEMVAHELAHVLENLGAAEDGEWLDFELNHYGISDGLPAGLSRAERDALVAAMDAEIPKIENGTSPLRYYALYADREMTELHDGYHEFWAVAVETFVEKPDALYDSNPDLYEALQDYFQLDPRNEDIFDRPGLDELAGEIFNRS